MREATLKQLSTIRLVIDALTDNEYTLKQRVLSGASIGQHIRHILEFYSCFVESINLGQLCYDNRKRDIRIETNRSFANKLIDSHSEKIQACTSDKPLKLHVDFSVSTTEGQWLDSSVFRELAYVLEHSIHHLALIKIGIHQLNRGEILDETFGIAPATLRHRSANAVHT